MTEDQIRAIIREELTTIANSLAADIIRAEVIDLGTLTESLLLAFFGGDTDTRAA